MDEWAGKLAAKSPVLMKLGKDAMYRQMDMPFEDALDYLRSQLTLAFTTEDIQEGVKAFFEKREPEWSGPMTVVAGRAALPHLRPHAGRRARASRRWRRWWRSAWDVEARISAAPGETRDTGFDEDLRDSRGCLLEAGGQVDDALTAGSVPVLLAADCSVCLTTLPAALRHRPDAKVLWLDAHGDFNTPDTTPSGYLGGMCLAGACGEWDAGLGDSVAARAGGAGRRARPRRAPSARRSSAARRR